MQDKERTEYERQIKRAKGTIDKMTRLLLRTTQERDFALQLLADEISDDDPHPSPTPKEWLRTIRADLKDGWTPETYKDAKREVLDVPKIRTQPFPPASKEALDKLRAGP